MTLAARHTARRGPATAIDVDRMARMREAGATYAEMSAALGRSPQAIRWQCLVHGVLGPRERLTGRLPKGLQTRGGRPVRAFTAEDDAELLRLEAEGLSYAEIGRRLDRRTISIRARLMTLARADAIAEQEGRT